MKYYCDIASQTLTDGCTKFRDGYCELTGRRCIAEPVGDEEPEFDSIEQADNKRV